MKYYYTDPLSSAWMAKHFGMSFSTTDESVVSAYEISQRFLDGTSNDNFRFYIHPDSLHLLQPQIGDVVHNIDVQKIIDSNNQGFFTWNLQRCPQLESLKDMKIIYRNGIPFMWPEKE